MKVSRCKLYAGCGLNDNLLCTRVLIFFIYIYIYAFVDEGWLLAFFCPGTLSIFPSLKSNNKQNYGNFARNWGQCMHTTRTLVAVWKRIITGWMNKKKNTQNKIWKENKLYAIQIVCFQYLHAQKFQSFGTISTFAMATFPFQPFNR